MFILTIHSSRSSGWIKRIYIKRETEKTKKPRPHLTASASGGCLVGRLRGWRGCCSSGRWSGLGLALSFLWFRLCCLLLLGLRGAVPVVQHLRGENEVQGETGKESVQNELVVNFLEGGENTRQRAGKVVEDLVSISARFLCVVGIHSHTAKALSCPVPPSCQMVNIWGTLLATPRAPAPAWRYAMEPASMIEVSPNKA